MNIRRTSMVLGAILAIAFAGNVSASGLHQDLPITGTDPAYHIVGCDEGWHFVHTGTTGAQFLPATLTVTFDGLGTVQVAGYRNGNSQVMFDVPQAVYTDTLTAAADDITSQGKLVLSHICIPEEVEPSASPTPSPDPDPTPTPEPTSTPTPEPTVTPEPTPSPTLSPTPSPTFEPTPIPTTVPDDSPVPFAEPTPPPTDTVETETVKGDPFWLILAAIFASVVAITLLQRPEGRRRR